MEIMVCKVYLSGQLVGVYPDSRKAGRGHTWDKDISKQEDIAGFQARAYAFFVNLFKTEAIKTEISKERI